MKIYTKTGDRGQTGLFGGTRLSKASLRVESYGQADELNSTLGMAIALATPDDALVSKLRRVQEELFVLGAELASSPVQDVLGGMALL